MVSVRQEIVNYELSLLTLPFSLNSAVRFEDVQIVHQSQRIAG